MHAVVMERLEEYLSGALEPAALGTLEAHLNSCRMCRDEVRGMQDISKMFGSLRSEAAVDPPLGFYAGVVRQIGLQAPMPSFAGIFTPSFAFARRLAFASLLLLAVLGSYLITRENGYPGGPSPEAIMAQEASPGLDAVPAQDNMLATLTAYEQH